MKLNKPKNENYAAIVVEIKTLVPLENCDNVQAAIILGNQVIVDKSVKIGDVGLYFPLECQLSKEYLSANNLYRKKELNLDQTKAGYFEENGRIRCVKFRGHKSEGLFMPSGSLFFIGTSGLNLNLNDCFDELYGIPICSKYIVKQSRTPGSKSNKSTKKYESKLVENQFRFHEDTGMLYKNLHRINPDSLISITYKVHGTSGISSYVLCKRKITKRERIGAFLNNIYTKLVTLGKSRYVTLETKYDYLYSSRKVIKNPELNPNAQHYYNEDIWGIAHKELEPYLQKGLSLYYEIVGYLPNGGMIQKDYDYGCKVGEHAIYIYRITQTNADGKVFEFSAKQVQDWCRKNGLTPVPQLFYNYAFNLTEGIPANSDEEWREIFLGQVKKYYNEQDCYICKNKVPEEGCVIRIEGLDFEAYKQKSNRFYELETKNLDKGESNIEDEN